MSDTAIKIENLRKQYRLGVISNSTLNAEIQSWWARMRGKDDPNAKLGQATDGRKTFYALDGINLEIKKGEAVGIIGSNGAGKSTLLKILARVTAPTEGDVWINGRISSMLEVGTGFHGELTGRENIYMNGAILGMSKKEVDAKIESIIDFSECREFIDTPVKRYSSGMYVKLAFAVAAHLDSEILIMDEVLAVGDMKFQKKCLGKMGDVAENEGKTVLYVSHNMATVKNLCNRCIVLQKGRIIFDGNVDEGISKYLEMDGGDLSPSYCFSGFKRANNELGKKIQISEVRFTDKKVARYEAGERICLSLKVRSITYDENFRIGVSLKYLDDSCVGFSFTDTNSRISPNEEREMTVSFDTNMLAPGTYYLLPELFYFDAIKSVHGLDQTGKVYFEIVDSRQDAIVWWRQFWGSIKFPLTSQNPKCAVTENTKSTKSTD